MSGGVSKSRLVNSKRNVISGIAKQLIGMILTFLIRTVMIYALGAEYQGLNGLFTAILQVLNLSDLGFSAAVTFILYKPIAEEDDKSICAIIAFLKRTYFVIGCVIMGMGILLLPFLPKLISGDHPNDINIYILYCIYLFNSVISYWLFAYKSTLLTAMQRADVVSKIHIASSLSIKLIQLVLLLVFRNYYVFIIVLPIGSILNNLLLQFFSTKLFPQIKAVGTIDKAVKNELIKQVKAVFLNRLSDIARNSFDDIIISSFLGLVAVTAYDNYYYIFSAVIGIMSIFANSVGASVGNSLVKESVEKNYLDLKKFSFIFMWLSGWITTCLFVLYQPFMSIWMKTKPEVILSDTNMALFCVYFYVFSMTYTKGVYLESKGLFWQCRYLYIIEALGNLGLNVILGHYFGITGVLVATIITITFVNFLGGTHVLFKHYFQFPSYSYLMQHVKNILITVINISVTVLIVSLIPLNGSANLMIRMAICFVIPNVNYTLFYYKSHEFVSTVDIAKKMLRRK